MALADRIQQKPNGIAARAIAARDGGLSEYQDHAIAGIFPLVRDKEFDDLVADVSAHGVREAIWLFEGKILDGRNRYRAAKAAGVTAAFRDFTGSALQALDLVWSLNRTRRHLNAGQAAIADAERNKLQNAYAPVKEAAKERQKATQFGGEPKIATPAVTEMSPPAEKPKKTRAVRAKAAGTSEGYINLADKLVETRPDLAEQVKQGEKTLTQVSRELKKEQVAEKVAALPEGRHRVIYADPPWSYNDTREGLGAADGQTVDRASTAAKNHYPTMPTAELLALDVKSLAADDAVLFCWATFPLLPDALEVVKAWGFKYKTSFIWDKQRGTFGHYHTAEAELLLVCTRGSCTPDATTRENQVQRWPRAEHSRKPEEARQMIDRLYVHGPRIELFRRGVAPAGWTVWGNEAVSVSEAA